MTKAAKEYLENEITIVKSNITHIEKEMEVYKRLSHNVESDSLYRSLKSYESQLHTLNTVREMLDISQPSIFQKLIEAYDKKFEALDINVYVGEDLLLQCRGTVDSEYIPMGKILDIHINPDEESKCMGCTCC